ncbi:hypothetical protein BC831DRAFT_466576 [Entophlyctis helioformis]|nr:hypothetical protein BC831DRAFT_466576 [Entophlyctis helioformis]
MWWSLRWLRRGERLRWMQLGREQLGRAAVVQHVDGGRQRCTTEGRAGGLHRRKAGLVQRVVLVVVVLVVVVARVAGVGGLVGVVVAVVMGVVMGLVMGRLGLVVGLVVGLDLRRVRRVRLVGLVGLVGLVEACWWWQRKVPDVGP